MKKVELDDLLKFDPLDTAEKITGTSIHDDGGLDNPSMALGFLLAQDHAKAKTEWLTELGDTTFSNKLDRYQSIIEKYGFEKVLEDTFAANGRFETYFIYAHKNGLLLSFDTFGGDRVNGGHVYYNWKPLVEIGEAWECTSSGGYHDTAQGLVWAGYHDCREALIHNLNKLNNRGQFVTPWTKPPFLWLLHYGDSKSKDYDHVAITKARIERMPEWVQRFISVSQLEEPKRSEGDEVEPEH